MDTEVCRSCMKQAAAWELANRDRGVILMFSACTNIQITDNDSLPQQFCYACTVQIESSYKFIQTAQRVNKTLLELHKSSCGPVSVNNDQIPLDAALESHENKQEAAEDVSSNVELCNVDDPEKMRSRKKKTDGQPLSCKICKKSFQSKVWFEKHKRNYHGKKYTCTVCAKTFLTQSRLSVHAVSHSDERQFACDCGKRYKRRKELTIHARTHADDRPFICDHCNMSFKLKSVLKCHLVLHAPDKPYLCSVCGWGFSQAGNLTAHMRTHSPRKLFACACGYRAAAAPALRRHQARHAPPRHRCRACRRAFHDKGALTRHERSHTGARPYQCPSCVRSFVDSWKRKCHLMRAHSLPLSSIPRLPPARQINEGQAELTAG